MEQPVSMNNGAVATVPTVQLCVSVVGGGRLSYFENGAVLHSLVVPRRADVIRACQT
jgi:hypothetical protein